MFIILYMLSFLNKYFIYWKQINASQKKDRVSLHSATLAYYFMFSLAPLVMMFVALGSLMVGSTITEGWLIEAVTTYFGTGASNIIYNIFYSLGDLETNIPVMLLSIVFIFFGATGLFLQLHKAFGDIFNFDDETTTVKASFLKRCQMSIYIIFSFIVMVLASLVNIGGNFVLLYGKNLLNEWTPSGLWIAANYFLGITVITFIFSLIYLAGSQMRLNWGSALVGAIFGSLLFTIVNSLFSVYSSLSLINTAFGPSSFLIVFLLWINGFFWSVLIGAEVAKKQYCEYPHHRRKICL